MPSKLRYHPAAVEELRAAKQWYEDQSREAERELITEIYHAIKRVTKSPNRWARYLHGTRRCIVGRFPYLVVYRQVGEVIQIIAIAHTSRRPGYWKERL